MVRQSMSVINIETNSKNDILYGSELASSPMNSNYFFTLLLNEEPVLHNKSVMLKSPQ